MADTDLILSISKIKLKKIKWYAAIVLIAACSHPKIVTNSEKETIKSIAIDLTPHSKTKPGFVDRTAEYGLENLKAVHLYAVKLNQDEFTDLVILEDYISTN